MRFHNKIDDRIKKEEEILNECLNLKNNHKTTVSKLIKTVKKSKRTIITQKYFIAWRIRIKNKRKSNLLKNLLNSRHSLKIIKKCFNIIRKNAFVKKIDKEKEKTMEDEKLNFQEVIEKLQYKCQKLEIRLLEEKQKKEELERKQSIFEERVQQAVVGSLREMRLDSESLTSRENRHENPKFNSTSILSNTNVESKDRSNTKLNEKITKTSAKNIKWNIASKKDILE